jgi:hypothetical protein
MHRDRRGEVTVSACGAGGMAMATFHLRPCTGPVALRGGRHGAATAPPARGPGTVFASGVGSAMATPPRLIFRLRVHSFDREYHVCEHPQRARDPWPEASTSAKSGSYGPEYSRVPPGRAVVVEAERSRVERGRPRDRGPARSGGCGGTSDPRRAVALQRSSTAPPAYWPHRLAGRAAWRRHCPSGEGARHPVRANGVGSAMASPPRVGVDACARIAGAAPAQRPCDAPLPVPFSVFSGSR